MLNIVYVENRQVVTVKKYSLRFFNMVTKEERFIPFEDIDYLIFDTGSSLFSEKLVEKCVENRISLLFLDRKHTPVAAYESIYGQENRLDTLKKQFKATSRFKKRIWRKIVIAKVQNQATCIEQNCNDEGTSYLLRDISQKVTEGDGKNYESYAARKYFPILFGKNFKRGRYSDIVNVGLNYGYAILRSVIRNELIMHALEPSFGIHHVSVNNPYNLSDDLIEPFRPFVDSLVFENIYDKGTNELDKKMLVDVLMERCVIDGKVYRLGDAIRKTVESYLRCLNTNAISDILLPQMIEGGR